MDLQMPVMDGMEALQRLRRAEKHFQQRDKNSAGSRHTSVPVSGQKVVSLPSMARTAVETLEPAAPTLLPFVASKQTVTTSWSAAQQLPAPARARPPLPQPAIRASRTTASNSPSRSRTPSPETSAIAVNPAARRALALEVDLEAGQGGGFNTPRSSEPVSGVPPAPLSGVKRGTGSAAASVSGSSAPSSLSSPFMYSRSRYHQFVVAVSANSDAETVRAATEAGADAFVAKPFSYDSFTEVLKQRGGGGCGGGGSSGGVTNEVSK
jgi:CheY-like chemotaxis protein